MPCLYERVVANLGVVIVYEAKSKCARIRDRGEEENGCNKISFAQAFALRTSIPRWYVWSHMFGAARKKNFSMRNLLQCGARTAV